VEYQPITPNYVTDSRLLELLEWRRAARLRYRVLVATYLAVGAFGGLFGGHALVTEYGNWLAWAISLMILEPAGLACLAGFAFMLLPTAATGGFLTATLRRATLAVLVVGLAYAGTIVGGVLLVIWEYWRRSS